MKRETNALIIGVAFLSFIAMGLSAGLMGVAWPSIRDSFGVSLDAIGALLFASTSGALLINLNSGPIISKIGLGPLLMIGCIIGGLGFVGFAVAPSWPVAVWIGLVSAVGTAGIIVGLNTFFAISQSARSMSWLQACFGLGATLSPAAMSRLLDLGYSWRWGYASVALIFAGLAVCFGYTLPGWRLAAPKARKTGIEEQVEANPAVKIRSRDTIRLPALWLSMLLFFTVTGMEGSAAQWPYTLFTEARSVDPGAAGLWVSLYWASMTLGRVFFGVVVDHVAAAPLIRLTMGGAIVGAALIWWHISDLLSFLGLALTGFALSPLFPVLTSTTPQRLGAEHAANAIGFQLAAVRLGLAAIPACAGVLAEAYGLEIIGPFIFAVSIAMFLLHEATVPRKAAPVGLQPF